MLRIAESAPLDVSPTTKYRRTIAHGAARTCSVHAAIARAIWPHKTAEHWAAAAGVKPRLAAYWLAGKKARAAGALALIRQIA